MLLFCFFLIEVGHMLFGLEKVRLHSKELKSSQEESVEGWGKESKREEKGVRNRYSKPRTLHEMSCFISVIFVWKYLGEQYLIDCECVVFMDSSKVSGKKKHVETHVVSHTLLIKAEAAENQHLSAQWQEFSLYSLFLNKPALIGFWPQRSKL